MRSQPHHLLPHFSVTPNRKLLWTSTLNWPRFFFFFLWCNKHLLSQLKFTMLTPWGCGLMRTEEERWDRGKTVTYNTNEVRHCCRRTPLNGSLMSYKDTKTLLSLLLLSSVLVQHPLQTPSGSLDNLVSLNLATPNSHAEDALTSTAAISRTFS